MKAYEASLKSDDTRLLLSPDSQFFRYFNDDTGKTGQAPSVAPSPGPSKPAEKPAAPADGGSGPEPEQGITAGCEASPQPDATADRSTE
jgi:hypothetical protein